MPTDPSPNLATRPQDPRDTVAPVLREPAQYLALSQQLPQIKDPDEKLGALMQLIKLGLPEALRIPDPGQENEPDHRQYRCHCQWVRDRNLLDRILRDIYTPRGTHSPHSQSTRVYPLFRDGAWRYQVSQGGGSPESTIFAEHLSDGIKAITEPHDKQEYLRTLFQLARVDLDISVILHRWGRLGWEREVNTVVAAYTQSSSAAVAELLSQRIPSTQPDGHPKNTEEDEDDEPDYYPEEEFGQEV